MGPGGLNTTLNFNQIKDDNVLVSYLDNDDASVYRLNEEQYIVNTVDVITPIVDDPYIYGQIAAANALSDVFAMGAKVLCALNICSFPSELTNEDKRLILDGAVLKVNEVNATITGGHTISEPSLLFGLSVTGILNNEKYFTNNMGTTDCDILITKPFGIGILYSANNNGLLDKGDYQKWINVMTTLNFNASQIAKKYIATMTDVTGFGLIGHSYEIAHASNITFEIDYNLIPFLEKVPDFAKSGYITNASYVNYEYLQNKMISNYDDNTNLLLCDPQTSGGLLLLVPKHKTEALINEFNDNNLFIKKIGITKEKSDFYINIL